MGLINIFNNIYEIFKKKKFFYVFNTRVETITNIKHQRKILNTMNFLL